MGGASRCEEVLKKTWPIDMNVPPGQPPLVHRVVVITGQIDRPIQPPGVFELKVACQALGPGPFAPNEEFP